VFEFIPPDEFVGVENIAAQLAAGQLSSEYENHWLSKTGEKRFIHWRNTILSGSKRNVTFLVATGIDITERRRIEKEMAVHAAKLAAANQDLESFSYSISHDLRGPLGIVKGFTAILSEDYGKILDAEGRNYLQRIDSSVIKMQQIIDSLLILSRLGRLEFERADINLSEMVYGYLQELREIEPRRMAEFKVQDNIHAYADPKLVQVALQNLIRNAWKFTSKREVTRIEFGMMNYKMENQEPVYFIRDNGAGFAMLYAKKIFEPFKRVHTEKEFSGTGVGLSIVQRVINRHDGKIWAEGEVDKGATFYFTLGTGEVETHS
jgi:light-regulated signal transduction histidine kinase (bacteriophytochrome)